MTHDVRTGRAATVPPSNDALASFVADLRRHHGVDIGPFDEGFLADSLAKRMASCGMDWADYHACVRGNQDEARCLWRALHVGYSEFFRNPLTFALLEQYVLPNLLQLTGGSESRGEVRIWSAGCATGQEVWSLAMLLDELSADGMPRRSFRIFASDISEQELQIARDGVYSAQAMGNVRARQLATCCERQGADYRIVPRLRERVDFSAYDLLDARSSSPQASVYGDFDLILCCNVLFYYRCDVQQQIVAKLLAALALGGYVVTGETERPMVASQGGLRSVTPPSAIFQKAIDPLAHRHP